MNRNHRRILRRLKLTFYLFIFSTLFSDVIKFCELENLPTMTSTYRITTAIKMIEQIF